MARVGPIRKLFPIFRCATKPRYQIDHSFALDSLLAKTPWKNLTIYFQSCARHSIGPLKLLTSISMSFRYATKSSGLKFPRGTCSECNNLSRGRPFSIPKL